MPISTTLGVPQLLPTAAALRHRLLFILKIIGYGETMVVLQSTAFHSIPAQNQQLASKLDRSFTWIRSSSKSALHLGIRRGM